MVTNSFLVVGCSKCDVSLGGAYGYIQILDPSTLKVLHTVEGRRGYEKVGRDVHFNMNSDYTEQIWYTTEEYGVQSFNSILAFYDQDSTTWLFYEREEIYTVETDADLIYTTEYRNIFYLENDLFPTLKTFQSCPVGTKYSFLEDGPDDDIDYEDEDWRLRTCARCGFDAPFSYGFNSDKCRTCEDVEFAIGDADSYAQHYYKIMCLGQDVAPVEETVRPTDPEGNPSPGTVDREVIITPETEEESGEGLTTVITIAVVLVVIVLGLFLFYNFYLKPRFYSQHQTARQGKPSPLDNASNSTNVTKRNRSSRQPGDIEGRASNAGPAGGQSTAKKPLAGHTETQDNADVSHQGAG